MSTVRGFTRTTLVAVLAAAVLLAALVWVILPSADARPATPVDPAIAAPHAPTSNVPASRGVPRAITASRSADDQSASGAEDLEIEVIAPTGLPAARARIALVRDEKLMGRATTDAAGLARLRSGEGEAGLVVLPIGSPTHQTTISIERGRRRIELPAGATISGRVEVDGHAPGEPVELRMHARAAPDGYAAFAEDPYATVLTSPGGPFEIVGLQAGSTWQFSGRDASWEVESVTVGTAAGPVIAPASNVLIKMKRFPVIRGRVVVGPAREAVSQAICTFATIQATGSMVMTRPAGADGRFAFAVKKVHDGRVVTRNELTVFGPQRVGRKVLTFQPPPDQDLDLGDVEVPTGKTVRFRAIDPAGKPIEGALVRSDQNVNPATRTDSNGLGTILVEPDQPTIWVGAVRHEVVEVSVPAVPPDPIPVVLPPCSGLDVRIATSPGTPLHALKVKVTSDVERPFRNETDPTGNDVLYAAAGATENFDGSWTPAGSAFTFLIPADGRVLVSGLKPGIAVTVAAFDRLDHAHASAQVTLTHGEWRTVDLRIAKKTLSLKGTVRDTAGKPVDMASVKIVASSQHVGVRGSMGAQLGDTTDQQGRFAIDGIFDGDVHLAVEKEGYAMLVRRNFPVPADGSDVDLRLAPGCKMVAKTVDAAGAPLSEVDVTVAVAGEIGSRASEQEAGTHLLQDLPCDQVVTLTARLLGREWTRSVRVQEGHVETFTLPAPGRIRVDFSEIGDAPYLLELKPDGETKEPVILIIETGPSPTPRVFETGAVLEGRYQATLLSWEHPGSPPAARVSGPLPVSVRAAETASLVFHKP